MEYKDLETGGFNFLFIFEEKTNEWVCKMPTWLINAAEEVLSANHKRERRHQLLVCHHEGRRDLSVSKRNLGPVNLAALLVILAAGDQMRAIRGTIDRHFPLRPATNRADAFRLGRAEPFGLALFTNRAGQW